MVKFVLEVLPFAIQFSLECDVIAWREIRNSKLELDDDDLASQLLRNSGLAIEVDGSRKGQEAARGPRPCPHPSKEKQIIQEQFYFGHQ